MEIWMNIASLLLAVSAFFISFQALSVRKSSLMSSIQAQIADRKKFVHELIVSDNKKATSEASRKAAYEELYDTLEMACHKYYAGHLISDDFRQLYGKEIIRIVTKNKYSLLTDQDYPYLHKFHNEFNVKPNHMSEFQSQLKAISFMVAIAFAVIVLGFLLSSCEVIQ